MPRFFIELSYKGTNYAGFQIQKNANSIQAELEKALSVFLKPLLYLQAAPEQMQAYMLYKIFFM